MTSFATLARFSEPVRIVLVGAGAMGANWAKVIHETAETRLAGVVDITAGAADKLLTELKIEGVPTCTSLADFESFGFDYDAVINVTVPAAHKAVITEGLQRGKAVLSEKPLAPTVAEAWSLAAVATVSGALLMTSQSRRYFRGLTAFKRSVTALGPVGILTNDFFKAPHFGGFREEMADPLLVDMGIHPFDAARFILDDEPVSVYCESFNPSWSWYDGDAAATALFTFSKGSRFRYTGSWCSPGSETSWNGSWRASSEAGTVLWNGEGSPTSTDTTVPALDPLEREEISGALDEFVRALQTGAEPSGIADRNLMSLAMVEAAVTSSRRGESVHLIDILTAARDDAILATTNEAERSWLAGALPAR